MRKFILGLLAIAVIATPIALTANPAQAAGSTKPTIRSFSAGPEDFYPTVRDGFKDGVTFRGSAATITDDDYNDTRQTWNVTVRNSNGAKVAERKGAWPDYDGIWWSWNGQDQRTGEGVRIGTYRATLTVTNPRTGETDTEVRIVRAKTDTVSQRKTVSRTGKNTSTRSHRGNCYIEGAWYGNGLDLDCWGGTEAVANYGFTLPHNATRVTWNVSGERGCCDDGQVVKTGNRTGDHFNVRVRVTNWAAYTVNRASVTYTTTVRR